MEAVMENKRNKARHSVKLILALLSLISLSALLTAPSRHASAQAVAPSWSYTGNLNEARNGHTATLLPNGKVVVAGGYGNGDLNSAELYDPVTGTWSITGNLTTARDLHTATLLRNGKVLAAGGTNNSFPGYNPLNRAEVYDRKYHRPWIH